MFAWGVFIFRNARSRVRNEPGLDGSGKKTDGGVARADALIGSLKPDQRRLGKISRPIPRLPFFRSNEGGQRASALLPLRTPPFLSAIPHPRCRWSHRERVWHGGVVLLVPGPRKDERTGPRRTFPTPCGPALRDDSLAVSSKAPSSPRQRPWSSHSAIGYSCSASPKFSQRIYDTVTNGCTNVPRPVS